MYQLHYVIENYLKRNIKYFVDIRKYGINMKLARHLQSQRYQVSAIRPADYWNVAVT